jgi:DNA (cytosine-5)-methyltransferase 1
MANKKLRVVELFAGVGGFRLGLEGWNGKSSSSGYKKKLESNFEIVWSNQREPATKAQPASDVYASRWGHANHSNEDICKVDLKDIKDHEVLVGGFPCQDYSVATTLKRSGGLEGKKGILWWEICRIIEGKGSKAPKYLILENVDRLLKSPAKQRGRDFAIILSCLNKFGYTVEWRVIDASQFGMPQRRRRTFILAYKNETAIAKGVKNFSDWITQKGLFAKAFPVIKSQKHTVNHEFILDDNLLNVSKFFNTKGQEAIFENAGVMKNNKVLTFRCDSDFKGKSMVLGSIIMPLKDVPKEFLIDDTALAKWKYLKGTKKEERKRSDGSIYHYAEGSMAFPDALDRPARTIITSEGGSTPSRFKHIIFQDGKYRRLTPIELERCNMFPDNHTAGQTDTKRAFFMGNALVVGVVEKIGLELQSRV